MESALALAGLAWLGALARLLPERDPHEAVYETLTLIAERLDDEALAPPLVARFEALILAECGFRLDLARCAATGASEGLAFVSPRSGRAVSAEAGAPWRDRLLPLPPFMREGARLEIAAERRRDRRRLSPDRLLSDARPVRGPRRALAGLRRAFLAAAAKARGG